jgi:hypothetical protein
MGSSSGARWILSFDASCGKCREISSAVSTAYDGKLEVLPPKHPDVQQWREQSLGFHAPWVPTLVRAHGDSARAWTGRSIVIPLVRQLGPRSTIHVLRSLGELRRQVTGHPVGQEKNGAIGRAQFLKLGAGVVVATGIIFSGQAPALAEPAECAMARRWVEENRDRLPQSYEEVIAYPVEYRKAIFSAQTPSAQSRLWVEHLKRYRSTHLGLSEEQENLIDRALATVSDESIFDTQRDSQNNTEQRIKEIEESSRKLFGLDGSYALIGTLGPSERPAVAAANRGCTCAARSDYCTNGSVCYSGSQNCLPTERGCGGFYKSSCDGLCQS